MAVKEDVLHHSTEDLILSSPRNFYRSHMHAYHWQLRSCLGWTQGSIYYCSGYEIQMLDPVKRLREVIATLTFEPRCLTASHDWVCCGGENGDFAAIKVCGPPSIRIGSEMDADARLDLDSTLRRSRSSAESARNVTTPSRVGKEIVNCVTIWIPESKINHGPHPTAHKSAVAVVSNNDRSITIVDLHSSDSIQTLYLSDCVNRALISPDGDLLVAIGDDPYLHVFVREQISSDATFRSQSRDFRWVEHSREHLQGQSTTAKKDDEMRGSFAAAFSPTGRYLAIGTQYGIIQVFDTQLLTRPNNDPCIAICSSSRPHTRAGAIRVLEFSAEPIGLLAVTEDSGRVFVIDTRNGFKSRQVIEVDSHADNVVRVGVVERPVDLSIDPRLRAFQSSTDNRSSFTDAERHQLQREMLSRDESPLTADETAVLEALQLQRMQRDRTRDVDDTGEEVTYTSTWTSDVRPSLILPQTLRDFVSGRNSTESLRAYITERNTERERRGQQPRRRGSVMLATAQRALERDSAREALDSDSTNNQPASSRAMPWQRNPDAPPNPWAQLSELEALYSMALDPPHPIDPAARMRVDVDADTVPRGDRMRRLTTHGNRNETRHFVRLGATRAFSRHPTPEPNDTTGCSWSDDGRILYVGTETGIYEYHVNLQSRKFHPALTMR